MKLIWQWRSVSAGELQCNKNKNARTDLQCREQYPGGGVLGSSFAGYVPLASQNLYPIIVYSVTSYRPHLSHFLTNVIVISRTEFNASRLLNNKTTARTIFQLRIFLFLNPCLPEFSYPENPENLRPHSSNSTKIVNPIIVSPVVKMQPHPAAHPQ